MIAYRAVQQGFHLLFRTTHHWQRLERRVRSFWSPPRVASWLAHQQKDAGLMGPAKYRAFLTWHAAYPEQAQRLTHWADEISAGDIEIFDQSHHFDWEHMPWDTDWRYGHRWAPTYYQEYSFYQPDKTTAYDVKFPWELSRLSFLIPLAQASVLGNVEQYSRLIVQTLADWEQANPLAHSVNWRAMECSMRGITLALVTQMLASAPSTSIETLTPLLNQLTWHGEFLYHNIEYTDLRGNHYAANLVALLLLGNTLAPVYRPARRWSHHAATRLCDEIELQYCEDGINFEKSTGYHRLVTEIYLLGLLVMEQSGQPVAPAAHERIWRACEYTRSYLRPDGLTPNWGDNDSSLALAFDRAPTRDHRPLLALAACYFRDRSFQSAAGSASAAIPWLSGQGGVDWWNAASSREEYAPVSRYFAAGGMVVSRSPSHYLFADFGEVGLKGRGGHGHNDTFSFELALAGYPLVIDAGSPTYTGDLASYNRFRSTPAHNVLSVDEEEMARLLQTWRISDEATPTNVIFSMGDEMDCIQGEHQGYQRLPDPVTHQRRLEFWKHTGKLLCTDFVSCAHRHSIRRWLHFAPGVTVTLESNLLHALLAPGVQATISWSPDTLPSIKMDLVSHQYGQKVEAPVLMLEDQIEGDTRLYFEIRLESST